MYLIQLVSDSTSQDWIDASIYLMNQSMILGSKIYPLICGLGLIRLIIESV